MKEHEKDYRLWGQGGVGWGPGRQAEESGTLCVPLEKSWLHLCIILLNAGAYNWSQRCLNSYINLFYSFNVFILLT